MITRRTFLRQIGKGAFIVATYPVFQRNVLQAAELTPTPPNIAGPYYEPGAPLKTNLREPGDSGTELRVFGELVDIHNRPIENGLIEIWHADAGGEYDGNGFRYRASMRTAPNGSYGFETYMPGNYGGRPRHIHYKISADQFEQLITQLYFENDPFFEGSPERTMRKDRTVGYRDLIRPVVPYKDGESLSVQFKICLAGNKSPSAKIFLERSSTI
jgi:protocatechuate 3,4-dioxygenase beta subunit